MVIVGDVDAGDLKKQVKKLFGKWKKGDLSTDAIPEVSNVNSTQIDFVNMPNAVQTEVSVQNTVSLRKKDADYFPLLIANGILGGGGEARLFLNLREDKGYTYGSYSRMGNNKYTASRFRASASVRNAVVDSAVVELLYEIDRMKKEVVSDEELNRAKAKYVGSFVRAVEQPSTVVNASGAKVEQMGNSMDLPPEMAADMQAVIGVIPELKMMENESITVSSIEEIDGQNAYALEMKGQSTTTTTYYAVESGLKLKQTTVTEMMGQTQTQDSNYNDYKRFGSLLIPSSTSVPLGPQSVDATLGTVKINGEAVNAE